MNGADTHTEQHRANRHGQPEKGLGEDSCQSEKDGQISRTVEKRRETYREGQRGSDTGTKGKGS